MSSKQNSTVKTFVFAIVMCVTCSLILTLAKELVRDKQLFNQKIDMQKNILLSFGLVEEKTKLSGLEIEKLYADNVIVAYLKDDGSLSLEQTELPLYVLGSLTDIKKYSVPFSAYGLWSYINGYIAIEGDGNTISGFTVYSHKETPGLGGECEKPWFKNQYIGKKLTDSMGKFVSIGVVKGKVEEVLPEEKYPNYVDGMSGATITGDGIERDLRVQLSAYEILSKRLREA